MKRLRLDWARLALATAAGGAPAMIMASALLRHARSTPHVGPTSATLDEALSELLGLGVGLFAGSALASILIRWGSPFVAGLTAGVATYSLVAAPYVFVTSDVGPSETWTFVLALFFFYFLTFVILGASLGWGINDIRRRAKTTAPSGR